MLAPAPRHEGACGALERAAVPYRQLSGRSAAQARTSASETSMSEFRINAVRAGSRRPTVRFEPTPHHAVGAMLQLAQVGPRDVLYDLGSGDGRIAIAAARRCGARAVGLEIDAARVQQATECARTAGLARRVRFVCQDLFDADLRPATVVTLFLLPEANWLLRPKLLRELAPGSRIVSYIHEMGDWKPRTMRCTVDRFGWYDRYYLWTVPARAQRRAAAGGK
jgi:SAM-dependent methyltransferase